MASLTGIGGSALGSSTTDVDSTQRHKLGTRAWDTSMNEYLYMLGVASTAANLAVSYDEDYTTTLLVPDAVGSVAIAQAATIADTYGWYLVKGKGTATAATGGDGVADNKSLAIAAGGGGELDDADAAGDQIVGIWSRGAAAAGATFTCQLDYPKVLDTAID